MRKIALFLPDLGGGGAERILLSLAQDFAERGNSVDLVLARANGPHIKNIPRQIRLFDLSKAGCLPTSAGLAATALIGLVRYLRRERPNCMLSSLTRSNLVALTARELAGTPLRFVLREANTSLNVRGPITKLLMRLLYPRADHVIAVSRGVASDLVDNVGLPDSRVQVIFNPVHIDHIQRLSSKELNHPWFLPGQPPVILGVGRLAPQKDFPTLLKAFAIVRRQVRAHLVILGEGKDRTNLERLVHSMALQADVIMPGFVENPYAYMKHARLFALSSRWEGCPNVLVEAMAVGTPVVSTNCHSGPFDILRGGRHGHLVPVGDALKLANAILDVLTLDQDHNTLVERASDFSLENIVEDYLKVLSPA